MRKMVLPDALKSIITNEVDVWYGVILIRMVLTRREVIQSADNKSRQICRMSFKIYHRKSGE
jgi:hypothetical protein